MRKVKKTLYYLITVLLVLPVVVFAVPAIPGANTTVTVGNTYNRIINLFKYAFGIAFGLAVIYLVWGGIAWMTAGGDEDKTSQARQKLIYGLVGILIIGGVYTLINLVADYFGFNIPSIIG